jgi:hypothetical protein
LRKICNEESHLAGAKRALGVSLQLFLKLAIVRSEVEALYSRHADFSQAILRMGNFDIQTVGVDGTSAIRSDTDVVLIQEDAVLGQAEVGELATLCQRFPSVVLRQPNLAHSFEITGSTTAVAKESQLNHPQLIGGPEAGRNSALFWPHRIGLERPIQVHDVLKATIEILDNQVSDAPIEHCFSLLETREGRTACVVVDRPNTLRHAVLAFPTRSTDRTHAEFICNLLFQVCGATPTMTVIGVGQVRPEMESVRLKATLAGHRCEVLMANDANELRNYVKEPPVALAQEVILFTEDMTIADEIGQVCADEGRNVLVVRSASVTALRGAVEAASLADRAITWLKIADPQQWKTSILCCRAVLRLWRSLKTLNPSIQGSLAIGNPPLQLDELVNLVKSRIMPDGSVDHEIGISCAALEVLDHACEIFGLHEQIEPLRSRIISYCETAGPKSNAEDSIQAAPWASPEYLSNIIRTNGAPTGAIGNVEAFFAGFTEVPLGVIAPKSCSEAAEVLYLAVGRLHAAPSELPPWLQFCLGSSAAVLSIEGAFWNTDTPLPLPDRRTIPLILPQAAAGIFVHTADPIPVQSAQSIKRTDESSTKELRSRLTQEREVSAALAASNELGEKKAKVLGKRLKRAQRTTALLLGIATAAALVFQYRYFADQTIASLSAITVSAMVAAVLLSRFGCLPPALAKVVEVFLPDGLLTKLDRLLTIANESIALKQTSQSEGS